MFDFVKGGDKSENRLLAEQSPDDNLEKLDHRVFIHVSGLFPLVFLVVRKTFPLRTAA
jgi:hypothetical protein